MLRGSVSVEDIEELALLLDAGASREGMLVPGSAGGQSCCSGPTSEAPMAKTASRGKPKTLCRPVGVVVPMAVSWRASRNSALAAARICGASGESSASRIQTPLASLHAL